MDGVLLQLTELKFAVLVGSADPGIQSHLDNRCGGRLSLVHTEVVSHRDNPSCATRQRRVFYFPDKGEICRLREFVSDLCQKYADLADPNDLGRRKNSKLRGINEGRWTDSVPGHQLNPF